MVFNIRRKIRYKIYKQFKRFLNYEASLERNTRFSLSTKMDSTVQLLESATVENLSNNPNLISIGKGSVIGGSLMCLPHGGKIKIGEFSYISVGSRLWSGCSIIVGDRVAISHNVNIHDTNSHSIDATLRHEHIQSIIQEGHPREDCFDIKSKPILINDDVWIGFNSTVLKGVTIGAGSIVAACAVVTKDVPESVIVAGNPATIIRKIF